MTTATITETLELPAGQTPRQVQVRLRLLAANSTDDAAGYATAADATVLGVWHTKPNGQGVYSFAGVRPNSGASSDVIDSPSGTRYELLLTYPDGRTITRYLAVPDSAGPHQVQDILSSSPSGLAVPSSHQALTDTASYGHPDTVISTDTDDGATVNAVLARWQLAKAEDQRAQLRAGHTTGLANDLLVVAAVGDSITQGWAATTFDVYTASSWARLVAESLARSYGADAPTWWVPMRAKIGAATAGWTTMQGEDHSVNATVLDYTAGGNGCRLDAGEYAEHHFVGTKVKVGYCKVSGGGDLEVYVDGVLATTVDTHDASYANPQSGFFVTVDGPTATSDTVMRIRVQPVDADPIYVDGGIPTTVGQTVAFYNLGHSGWKFETVSTDKPGTINFLTALAPNLVLEAMGINNRTDSASVYQTKHEALLDALDTACPGSARVYIHPWRCGGYTADDAAFASLVEETRQASITRGWAFLDMSRWIDDTGSGEPGEDLTADTVHIGLDGHLLYARQVLAALGCPPTDAQAAERRVRRATGAPIALFGLYSTPPHAARSTATFADQDLLLIPFLVPWLPQGITNVGFELVTAGSGTATAYIGLYSPGGYLMHQYGAVDLTGATGAKTGTAVTIPIPDQTVMLGIGFEGANVATATLRTMTGGQPLTYSAANLIGAGVPIAYDCTGAVSGALPQTAGLTYAPHSAPPLMFYTGG